VQDDPAFSTGPFASLTSLDVGVKLIRLLSKKVEIEEITLCDPFITVIKNRKGEMNLSTIGPKTPATSSPEQLEAPSQPTGNPLQVLALLRWTASLTQRHHPLSRDSTPKPTEYRVTISKCCSNLCIWARPNPASRRDRAALPGSGETRWLVWSARRQVRSEVIRFRPRLRQDRNGPQG
jgi:hypothetical protein